MQMHCVSEAVRKPAASVTLLEIQDLELVSMVVFAHKAEEAVQLTVIQAVRFSAAL